MGKLVPFWIYSSRSSPCSLIYSFASIPPPLFSRFFSRFYLCCLSRNPVAVLLLFRFAKQASQPPSLGLSLPYNILPLSLNSLTHLVFSALFSLHLRHFLCTVQVLNRLYCTRHTSLHHLTVKELLLPLFWPLKVCPHCSVSYFKLVQVVST